MTSRQLRSRAVNPPGETRIIVPSTNTVLPPQTERPVSYRDAVVSRPTSPANNADGNQAPSNGDQLVSTTSNQIGATNPSLEPSPSQEPESLQEWMDDNPNPWIRVGPRKTRSLESLNSRATRPSEHVRIEKEIDPAVRAAEKQLTNAQKELIARRNKQVTSAPGNSTRESTRAPEAGTSKNKGKIIDPCEWGNLNLDEEEVDLQAQEAALESYRLTLAQKKKELKEKALQLQISTEVDKNANSYPASRSPEPNRRVQRKEKIARVPESRPVDQIAPDSYLGKALEKLTDNRRDNPDDDPSSSESSSSSSSDSEPEPRTSRRKKRKSKKRSRTTLKPIPPSEYDGSADARAYHRFITEGTAYLVDGKVKRNRRVFVLSYYLKGKAYDFYTQKISMNNEEWNLKEFFQAMFDYCFPVNYRTEQRDKLKRTYQNNKTVVAFVYELEELYNMIGSTAERDKVLKLWYGLRTSIQQALWRDGFNPEISSWDEVINGAEIIEISEGVTAPRNRHQPELRDQSNNLRSGPPRRQSTFQKGTRFERQTPNRGDSQPPSREQSSSSGKPNNRQRSFSSRPPSRGFSNHSRTYHNNNNSRQNTPKTDQPKSSELSDKERSELLAEGRCFRCKEKGHLSRNCPTGNSVRSNDKRPPGVSNNNIEFEFQEDDEVQVLDNLELGMMEFDGLFHYPLNWGDYEPDWMKYDPSEPRRTELGDGRALHTAYTLDIMQPLSGAYYVWSEVHFMPQHRHHT